MANNKINYKDLLAELNEEIKEGTLTQKDKIQVLRDAAPVYADYCPIIDWYYDAFSMKEEFATPLEEMYLPEEFSKEEWQDMLEERKLYEKQYKEDQDKLVEMTVKDVITEMNQMQKLFR